MLRFEILREDYLKALGLTAYALALGLRVPASRINDIVLDRRAVTADQAQPQLLTPVLQFVHTVLSGFLLGQAGLKSGQADSGAVTLIQRFGSAAQGRSACLRPTRSPLRPRPPLSPALSSALQSQSITREQGV